MKLDLDVFCVENGPTLSWNWTPCFKLPIIVKCNKFTTLKNQELFNSNAFTCSSIDKDLVL
jgi:hypothetical protein